MGDYKAIFARSFSRNDQKKFGYGAVLTACWIIAYISFTVFKPSFSHLPTSNLRFSVNSGLRMLIVEDSSSPAQRIADGEMKQEIKVADIEMKHETKIPDIEMKQETKVAYIEMKHETKVGDTEMEQEIKVADSKMEQDMNLPVCNLSDPRSDFCEIDGDIRILGETSTILFASSQNGMLLRNESLRIRPYARKTDKAAMAFVNELVVKPFVKNNENEPYCDLNHSVPAIIFSVGGYGGNNFHAYTDILVPLFLTSHQFHQEVQFLVTDSKPYWITKHGTTLKHLSRYPIIDLDKESNVHCYRRVIIGLKFHKDMIIDPLKSPKGYSMKNFTQFLRNAYSLKRSSAIKIREGHTSKKPRLLIVSRKRTRKLTNEAEIASMAKSLGYEVILAEPGVTMTSSRFADVVNSCDVMMGIHGAGLTNLVFLPTNAVLIQIIPLGELEWFSRHCFGEPAKEMNLKYLEYKIREEESTLIEQYPLDHAVFKDPHSFAKQGWIALKSVYLDKQDVKLDAGRFRATLLSALELLHH